jgi:hypothetical protein
VSYVISSCLGFHYIYRLTLKRIYKVYLVPFKFSNDVSFTWVVLYIWVLFVCARRFNHCFQQKCYRRGEGAFNWKSSEFSLMSTGKDRENKLDIYNFMFIQTIPLLLLSWRPVLVVEEARVSGENRRPWASNW